MEKVRQVTMEGGGRAFCVSKVLLGRIIGGFTLWGGDLGVVGGNDLKNGGGTRGFSLKGDGQDSETEVGQDMEKSGGRNCPQGSGDPDTRDGHGQTESYSVRVGDVETYL